MPFLISLFLVVIINGCSPISNKSASSKKNNTKIDVSIHEVFTNQSENSKSQLNTPLYVFYTFKLVNNSDYWLNIESTWGMVTRDTSLESFVYGVYQNDTLMLNGGGVDISPSIIDPLTSLYIESKSFLSFCFNPITLEHMYNERTKKDSTSIQGFIQDIVSHTIIYFVYKPDTFVFKNHSKVNFLGEDGNINGEYTESSW